MAVEYEIVKKISILSERDSGWNKELNLVSWSGKEAKYDIREWAPNHQKMGKGVTMTEDELYSLFLALKELFNEEVQEQPASNKPITEMFFGK